MKRAPKNVGAGWLTGFVGGAVFWIALIGVYLLVEALAANWGW